MPVLENWAQYTVGFSENVKNLPLNHSYSET